MADVLALPFIYHAVVDRFAAEGLGDVEQPFGFDAPAQNVVSRRITWEPGDPQGALGDVITPRNPGQNPRSLATLLELFTCTISAADETAPTDRLAQYVAVRLLFDAWWSATFLAQYGVVAIVSATWLRDKKLVPHGAALQVVCSVEAVLPDAPDGVMHGGEGVSAPRAVGTVSLLDVDETLETRTAIPTVRVATTEALALLEGEQTVDGIALVAGDRVLVRAQPDATTNGVYVVFAGAWMRADDELAHGYFVHVLVGTTNALAGFELETLDPIDVGTTALDFVRTTPEVSA